MRPLLNGPEIPFFTGQTAWRAVIPAEPGAQPAAQVFMGPGRHLVSYPVGQGMRNIVAVVERPDWRDEGWSQPGVPPICARPSAISADRLPDWLAAVDQVSLWGLFRHPVAAHWQRPAGQGPALVCWATPAIRCAPTWRRGPAWRSRMPPCWRAAFPRTR
ncbi:Rossmann-fold NAD(P)-binding domain-containing protein [Paracoccus mutanolyticus]|nr:hypothetical protein [Paracoccus mutanolyticus]